MSSSIIAVLLSSLFWSMATQFYSFFGKKISVNKLNFYKSLIGFTLFLLTSLLLFPHLLILPTKTISLLLLSGFLGYTIGDLLIFYSFTHIGPAKTLLIASFQPFLLALLGTLFLDKQLKPTQYLGLLFLFTCLLCLYFDEIKKTEQNSKMIRSSKNFYFILLLALIGVIFDSFGLIISKLAFNSHKELNSFVANTYRSSIALLSTFLILKFYKSSLSLKYLTRKEKSYLFFSIFLGTYVALSLYLFGLSKSHPAIVGAIGSTTPIYSSIYEHYIQKRGMTIYYIMALISMVVGVFLIIQEQIS